MSDRKLPKTGSKAPDPIDVAVGRKIKARRRLQGICQEDLGAAIGVTFQQVQKYEKGTNRVSASRLHQIADVLGMPASEFFPKPAGEVTRHAGLGVDELAGFIETNEGRELNVAFSQIGSPALRKKIVGLVKALSESGVK